MEKHPDDMTAEELRALIGNPPEGSHPDEALPRATTWHEERANWRAEVDRLNRHIEFIRGWYGERWANLRELFDGTPIEKRACDIMANGFPNQQQ